VASNRGAWPPTYDSETLASQIQQLVSQGNLAKRFYIPDPRSLGQQRHQGDVVRFASPIPVIDSDGEAVALDNIDFWLVLSNTCDLERDEVEWSAVIPIERLNLHAMTAERLDDLQKYRLGRKFFLPEWGATTGTCNIADFLRPVTIHKKALMQRTEIEASMTDIGWLLFHCCLVRYLARGDGRES
jgi:hypothetical protein